jgi:molecular chaperone GrpE
MGKRNKRQTSHKKSPNETEQNNTKELEEETKEEVSTNENSSNTEEKDELTKCKEELEALNDKYLRAHADFENMKKRLEREKSNAVIFANENFATDLLSVIDSFESAISSINQIEGESEAIEKIKEGISLTYDQFLKVLKKHGVEEINNEGVFDPNVHQVVQQVESDEHEKDEIVNTLQKGYKLKERVLRPSIVVTKK